MPMWRCPHCGTPQAETARCWVCRRSSTACATCRHFRRSVAAQVGFCGLDRQRRPLTGDEIRACWEAAAAPPDGPVAGSATSAPTSAGLAGPAADRTPVHRLEFVEVPSGPAGRARQRGDDPMGAAPVSTATTAPAVEATPEPAIAVAQVEPTWSLWGDAEP